MAIFPVEANMSPDPSSTPKPIFSDQHITVYGVPIDRDGVEKVEGLETLASEGGIEETSVPMDVDPASSLKRKREVSPDSPSKRPVVSPEGPPTLAKLRQSAQFSPTSLQGPLADEWRKLMVQTMFPNTKPVQTKAERKYEERQAAKKLKEAQQADSNAQTSSGSPPAPPPASTQSEASAGEGNVCFQHFSLDLLTYFI